LGFYPGRQSPRGFARDSGEAGQKAGKRVEFTMTTNATYLTPEVIQFLSDNRIGVSVSIDGLRSTMTCGVPTKAASALTT